jgi:hypothetical protein
VMNKEALGQVCLHTRWFSLASHPTAATYSSVTALEFCHRLGLAAPYHSVGSLLWLLFWPDVCLHVCNYSNHILITATVFIIKLALYSLPLSYSVFIPLLSSSVELCLTFAKIASSPRSC